MRLSRRLESPLVIMDEAGEGSVLVSLDQYEALLPKEGEGKPVTIDSLDPTESVREDVTQVPLKMKEDISQEKVSEIVREPSLEPLPEPVVGELISEENGGKDEGGEPDIEAQFYLEPVE